MGTSSTLALMYFITETTAAWNRKTRMNFKTSPGKGSFSEMTVNESHHFDRGCPLGVADSQQLSSLCIYTCCTSKINSRESSKG